ncbi:MAG: FumA C-terminus/TtdB family hydratase beta subunit [Eubacteriales bacterium]|nr:FumA C-terminus/TtdB family hydratase beta subunit [Eubacteriales bacterium]
MSGFVRITVPLDKEGMKTVSSLRAGDRVLLSGTVYTARDQAHMRMAECIASEQALPFELSGSAIYYVGPTPEHGELAIGSAGPTTAGRMDAFSPMLLDLGNKIMIGKGRRSREVTEAVVRNGAVYLGAVGGAGALMSAGIKKCEVIAWPDLGCEAVRRLEVEDMPLTVVIDSTGNDLYLSGPEDYLNSLKNARYSK